MVIRAISRFDNNSQLPYELWRFVYNHELFYGCGSWQVLRVVQRLGLSDYYY